MTRSRHKLKSLLKPADFGQRDPLNQAKSAGARVHQILHDCTGRKVFVRPVLLYPGWWVNEPRPGIEPDAWVMNPERFVGRLKYAKPVLSDEDIGFLAANLRRHLSKDKT